MPKLTDTQRVILSAACQRDGFRVLPLPETLKGGAARKVADALIAKGLVAEVPVSAGDPVWRQGDDGGSTTLVATDAALTVLGIEPDHGAEPVVQAEAGQTGGEARLQKTADSAPRAGTKQAQLIAMLERPEGATITEIAEALDWQAHTVRGAISGALKKKLGLDVGSRKVEGRGCVYHLSRD